MSNPNGRLLELYRRFHTNELSTQELQEFLQMMNDPANQRLAEGLVDQTWFEIRTGKQGTPQIPIIRRPWFVRAASVAAVILFIFVSGYFFFPQKKSTNTTVIRSATAPLKTIPAPVPGRNLAILTLGNGRQILLDSSEAGTLASEGNTKIIKIGSGQLSYAATQNGNPEIAFNTLSTPRGGQYQVELPDGSQVWLNSDSRLHFPTVFTGAERIIDLSGEAYFEVAKNKKMPFVVKVNGSEIRVFGTHFNVNGYADEALTKTTLLEGSVQVSKGESRAMLIPGQQAQVNVQGENVQVSIADTEEAIAWKNGYFQFNKSDISSVMKQLSRWYDLEVRFQGQKPEAHFRGKISRSLQLSEMMKVIEASGVRCKLEGKTLVILP